MWCRYSWWITDWMKNAGMCGAFSSGWMRISSVTWLYEPRRMERRRLRVMLWPQRTRSGGALTKYVRGISAASESRWWGPLWGISSGSGSGRVSIADHCAETRPSPQELIRAAAGGAVHHVRDVRHGRGGDQHHVRDVRHGRGGDHRRAGGDDLVAFAHAE